jgi:hypothetical protein
MYARSMSRVIQVPFWPLRGTVAHAPMTAANDRSIVTWNFPFRSVRRSRRET